MNGRCRGRGSRGRKLFRAKKNKDNPGPTGANRPRSGSLSLGKGWGKGRALPPPRRPATPDVRRGETRRERRHQALTPSPWGAIRGTVQTRRKMTGKTFSPGPRRATRGTPVTEPALPLGRASSPTSTTLITAEEASPGKMRARSKV